MFTFWLKIRNNQKTVITINHNIIGGIVDLRIFINLIQEQNTIIIQEIKGDLIQVVFYNLLLFLILASSVIYLKLVINITYLDNIILLLHYLMPNIIFIKI